MITPQYYRALQGGLLPDYIPGHIIVRKETSTDNLFFQLQPIDLYQFICQEYLNNVCLHEVSVEGQYQKFKIDLDQCDEEDVDTSELINIVVTAIIDVFRDLRSPINEQDILLFSSCNNRKWSYHIVVSRWVLTDHHVAKYIADEVKNKSGQYSRFIDNVYKSIQSFRLPYCFKLGTDRQKLIMEEWNYFDVTIQVTDDLITQFYNSLITYTENCQVVQLTINIPTYSFNGIANMSEDYYQQVVDEYVGEGVYEVSTIRDNQVRLKRLKKAYCPICYREHGDINGSGDNAILYVTSNSVLFRCWRNDNSVRIADHITTPEVEDKDIITTMNEPLRDYRRQLNMII